MELLFTLVLLVDDSTGIGIGLLRLLPPVFSRLGTGVAVDFDDAAAVTAVVGLVETRCIFLLDDAVAVLAAPIAVADFRFRDCCPATVDDDFITLGTGSMVPFGTSRSSERCLIFVVYVLEYKFFVLHNFHVSGLRFEATQKISKIYTLHL